MARWQSICDCFPVEQGKMMETIFPYAMQIDAEQIMYKPTAADPLAAQAPMKVSWTTYAETGQFVVAVELFGVWSPWMEPAPLRTWLLVEYPELIRMKP